MQWVWKGASLTYLANNLSPAGIQIVFIPLNISLHVLITRAYFVLSSSNSIITFPLTLHIYQSSLGEQIELICHFGCDLALHS